MIGAGTLGLLTIAALRHLTRAGTHHRRGQAPRAAAAGPRARRRQSSSSPASSPRPCARATGLAGGRRPAHRRRRRRHRLRRQRGVARRGARGRRARRHVVARRHARPRRRRPHRRCGTGRSTLLGAYAYGTETRLRPPHLRPRLRLVHDADLGRLVSATYPARPLRGRHRPRRRRRRPRRGEDRVRPPRRAREERSTVPRPGFVLDVDRSTPPILFHHGEGFRLEQLPAGRSRVIYPAEPLDAARRPRRAPSATRCSTRSATASRCRRCCCPGMKLTIAFDDISLPLPPMQRPDIRQRVIEAVLDLAADAGVDDVAPHRRARPAPAHDRGRAAPRASATGSTTPSRRTACSTTTTPRTPTTWCSSAHRPGRGGRDQQAGGRERPARLRQHQPRRHGRRPEDRRPPAWRRTERCATTTTCRRCSTAARSWTSTQSELHSSNWRMGRCIAATGVKVFQIETTLNNDTFPQAVRVPAEARVGVVGARPCGVPRGDQGARAHAAAASRVASSRRMRAPYGDHRRARRRGRGGARGDDRERLPPAAGAGARARPTS